MKKILLITAIILISHSSIQTEQPEVLLEPTMPAVQALALPEIEAPKELSPIKVPKVKAAQTSVPTDLSSINPQSVIALTNIDRAEKNLGLLTENAELARAARAKAEALVACSCFAHDLPDGRTPWTFIKATKYDYWNAGENLAVHHTDPKKMQADWMKSTGHRANILEPTYKNIGVAVVAGRYENHDTTFVVVMFGNPIK
jgi:uncharacterized protein YkwD